MRRDALPPGDLIHPAEVAAALEEAKAARDEVNRLIQLIAAQKRLEHALNRPATAEVF